MRAAVSAPSGATSYSLGDLTLQAPPDHVFDQILAGDFDGDRQNEALAFAVARTPGATLGELWTFAPGAAPRALFTPPALGIQAGDCRPRAGLTQTGPRTVTLDVVAVCSGFPPPRSPIRSLTVLAPAAARPVILALRATAPSPGESLDLAVNSSDQDGDGRDDVAVTVRVGATGQAASAMLRFLDRAAGVSADPREPAGSLLALANKAMSLSKQKKNAQAAVELVQNARRLFAALCGAGGAPRLFDAEGAPIQCGNLTLFHDRLALAESQAALARGDLVGASSVLVRDGWYGRRMTDEQRIGIERAEEGAVELVPFATVITPAATPVARTREPRWSPLAFEAPEQTLLVQTASGMIRIAADGSREDPVGPQPRAWPLEVKLSSGARWTGIAQSCDRSEAELTFAGAEPGRLATAELLAPRPAACGGPTPEVFPGPIALGTRGNELEAVVAGVHVGPAATPPTPGSARSADGRFLVVPSPLGILVLGRERPELWRSPRIAAPAALTDCVVSNGGMAVACTLAGRVVILNKALRAAVADAGALPGL